MSQARKQRRNKDRTGFARALRAHEGVPVGWAQATGAKKQARMYQRHRAAMQRNGRFVTSVLLKTAGHGDFPHTLHLRVPTKFQMRNELARMTVAGDSYTPSKAIATPVVPC